MKNFYSALFVIVLLACSFLPRLFAAPPIHGGRIAEISIEGKVIKRINLTDGAPHQKLSLKTRYGENEVIAADGRIFVNSADCPHSDCVRRGAISNVGEVIVCLPHKLLVEITVTENGL